MMRMLLVLTGIVLSRSAPTPIDDDLLTQVIETTVARSNRASDENSHGVQTMYEAVNTSMTCMQETPTDPACKPGGARNAEALARFASGVDKVKEAKRHQEEAISEVNHIRDDTQTAREAVVRNPGDFAPGALHRVDYFDAPMAQAQHIMIGNHNATTANYHQGLVTQLQAAGGQISLGIAATETWKAFSANPRRWNKVGEMIEDKMVEEAHDLLTPDGAKSLEKDIKNSPEGEEYSRVQQEGIHSESVAERPDLAPPEEPEAPDVGEGPAAAEAGAAEGGFASSVSATVTTVIKGGETVIEVTAETTVIVVADSAAAEAPAASMSMLAIVGMMVGGVMVGACVGLMLVVDGRFVGHRQNPASLGAALLQGDIEH